MSFSRRCAMAPVGNVFKAAQQDPMWEVKILSTGELWLRHKTPVDQLNNSWDEFEGHYVFPHTNVNDDPNFVTTTVVSYGFPSKVSNAELLKLIRSAK